MNYLKLPYKLEQVEPQMFIDQALNAAKLQLDHTLADTLMLLLGNEDPILATYAEEQGFKIRDSYRGVGGSEYSLALGIGVSALRKANPFPVVPAINIQDWNAMTRREAELRTRLPIRTLEEEIEVGLDEVSEVNDGYVEGFFQAFRGPALAPTLGFCALGVLCAHDLIHFASVRE